MNEETMWIEKYRPKKVDEIIGQEEVIKRLEIYVKDNKLKQHLLFAGPAGTGKTTSAITLAMELFGDNWRSDFKELNASDTRGIDVIRDEVKSFAATDSINNTGFKIILLDEADALTSDAQSALRRIMERYSKICKFILTCNYSSKIIEPIQSRCAVYRFKGIGSEEMKKRLLYICGKEHLIITDDALESLIFISEGDLRSVINSLQSASLLGNVIDISMIYKSSGVVKKEDIENLVKKSLLSEVVKSFDILDTLMINEGFAGIDILKQMFRVIMRMNIDDKMKVKIVDRIGETDFRINEGANERIQMRALVAGISVIGSK